MSPRLEGSCAPGWKRARVYTCLLQQQKGTVVLTAASQPASLTQQQHEGSQWVHRYWREKGENRGIEFKQWSC